MALVRTSDRRRSGADAELRAAALLQAEGFKVLLRNFRCRAGELDIVAQRGQLLVIAEVRLRSNGDFGGAAASITASKRSRIVRATRYLLQRRPTLARLWVRFDILVLSESGGPIEWIDSAFDAGRSSAI
jgi:putative endonuclease